MRYLLLTVYLFASIKIGVSFIREPRKVYTAKTEEFVIETLTVYNPLAAQTDSSPLITASNAKIDTVKLKKGKLRWLALSRDFLKRFGGKINYGDTVEIISGDSEIDGLWVVHDTMNKRYKKRGDLLTYNRKKGKWKNVRMIKL